MQITAVSFRDIMMIKKIFKNIFVWYRLLPALVFVYWVFYPFVANMFSSNTELLDNRPLKKKPTELNLNFPKDYEAYYNDTFAGRKRLLKKYGKIQYKLGIDNGISIQGQKGWAFYDSAKVPDGYTLIDYFGEVRFSEEELQQMAQGVEKAREFYARQGIDYIIVIAPNKEAMYSEYMPERLQKQRKSDKSRMDLAVEYLQKNTKAKIINFKDALMAAKKELPMEIYFPLDSHWNEIGGYVGYTAMAEYLNTFGYHLPVKKISEDMITVAGSQKSDLDVAGIKDTNYHVAFFDDMKIQCLKYEDHGFMQIYKNPHAREKKTLFMIRDSFGMGLVPYLNKAFQKTVYAHNKHNKREQLEALIEEHKPDIMVDELVERYFDRFLKYNDLYGDKK